MLMSKFIIKREKNGTMLNRLLSNFNNSKFISVLLLPKKAFYFSFGPIVKSLLRLRVCEKCYTLTKNCHTNSYHPKFKNNKVIMRNVYYCESCFYSIK